MYNLASGIPLVLGLRIRMQDPHVDMGVPKTWDLTIDQRVGLSFSGQSQKSPQVDRSSPMRSLVPLIFRGAGTNRSTVL